ncbi:hydrolase Cof [Thermoanaerobacterium sp. PSU-2]|uniref:Cof-type HAD-IIB family hydrolase n=1 Tax=Thermoanaerobacterium sp. PSU-2 TaxID=1930849 RepID=UPI000A1543E2|nr:Cof-type HAD-IIB family hydrolase [Thermoanaerobacterium sp. PSU-2]ORX22430.1 hydrolase Cof [Thermoanaerobacterium sp. PSU-2]
MKYKMVVADADGTLLDDKKKISEVTKNSVKKFRNMRGIFTLATGRGIISATPYIKELDIDVPVILFNGCVIYDHINKKILHENYLSDDLYKLIAKKWQEGKYDVDILVYSIDGIYINKISDFIKSYMETEHVKCDLIEDLSKLDKIIKVLFRGNRDTSLELVDEIRQSSNEPFTCVQSDEYFIEILPYGITKGSALIKLCDILNVDINQVVAIGDQDNDKEMIIKAGFGVAMGNADDAIKRNANYVAKSNLEDGVSDVIEKIIRDEF